MGRCGTGHRRAAGVTLGTGLGSAFLEDGRIVDTGPRVPFEGSLHLVSYRGRPAEETVSRAALLASYGDPRLDVRDVAIRARNGDRRARRVFDELASALGEITAPWLDSFGASCLVVGGSISQAWDLLARRPARRTRGRRRARGDRPCRACRRRRAARRGAPCGRDGRPRSPCRSMAVSARRLAEHDGRRGAPSTRLRSAPRARSTLASKRESSQAACRSGSSSRTARELHPLCVWFPGGGWVLDTLDTSAPALSYVAAEAPCAFAVVRYRLAPEHRFPAPLDDCVEALRWLVAEAAQLGIDPSRIAVGGTSAGANLAAALALASREAASAAPPIAGARLSRVALRLGHRIDAQRLPVLRRARRRMVLVALPRARGGRRERPGLAAPRRPPRSAARAHRHRRARPAPRRGRALRREAAAVGCRRRGRSHRRCRARLLLGHRREDDRAPRGSSPRRSAVRSEAPRR